MSKAVMISIQPKWCELIASGKKAIEVRKTAPKLPTPFKCYIYMTKRNSKNVWCGGFTFKNYYMAGKVIGEFMCDRVEAIACHKYNNGVGFDYTYYTESKDTLIDETRLDDYDIQQYLGCAEDGECAGYAWHISDLVIYDKPKELGEFVKPCANCPHYDACIYFGWQDKCNRQLARPPQNWCYVEPWRE